MNSDRELLELAAKAAGIEGWLDPVETVFIRAKDRDGALLGCAIFDPFTDDGDALRLAVKLRIKFRYNEALGQAFAWLGGSTELDDNRASIEDFGGDECACARNAIVRAAARIGEKA